MFILSIFNKTATKLVKQIAKCTLSQGLGIPFFLKYAVFFVPSHTHTKLNFHTYIFGVIFTNYAYTIEYGTHIWCPNALAGKNVIWTEPFSHDNIHIYISKCQLKRNMNSSNTVYCLSFEVKILFESQHMKKGV